MESKLCPKARGIIYDGSSHIESYILPDLFFNKKLIFRVRLGLEIEGGLGVGLRIVLDLVSHFYRNKLYVGGLNS